MRFFGQSRSFVGWIKRSGSTVGRVVDPLRLIHPTKTTKSTRTLQNIQRTLHALATFVQHMGINHRRRHIAVA